jgi:hypothetical protein
MGYKGSVEVEDFRETTVYTELYTRQADGTLTTWLAPRAKLEKDWSGSKSFGEVLDAASRVRLLREDNLRIEGEGTQAYVRLGHDALAKVAAAWRAEREEQEQLQRERKRRRFLIGSLVVSVVLTTIFALGGLRIYQNNLELDRKNLELDRKNLGLRSWTCWCWTNWGTCRRARSARSCCST